MTVAREGGPSLVIRGGKRGLWFQGELGREVDESVREAMREARDAAREARKEAKREGATAEAEAEEPEGPGVRGGDRVMRATRSSGG